MVYLLLQTIDHIEESCEYTAIKTESTAKFTHGKSFKK